MPTDDTPRGPLSGLAVVDLTRIPAGPYAPMLRADLGARAIKGELPGQGDDTREVGPFLEHETGGRTSACFASVHRNMASIALDLQAEADRAIFERLLDRADVRVDLPLPGSGALAVDGCPVKFADAPAPRFRAAPQLDQHRGTLLAELGLAPA
jgi:CoA:oxalate CoA-transferase